MERLKSWFLSSYLLLATLACVFLLMQLVEHLRIELLGALMACSAMPGFFLWLYVRRPARTSAHLFGVTAYAWLGACLAVFGTLTSRDPLWWPVLFALPLGLGGFLLYLLWYSRLPRRRLLQRLVPLPSFTAYQLDGTPVTSDSLVGTPTVWIFFRGNWCPLCVAQVREIVALHEDLTARGVRVVLVSPQPLARTQALARRFDVPLMWLQDRDGQAARALGIELRYGVPAGLRLLGHGQHTLMPTLVVTSKEGDVVYVDQSDNYRLRPRPQAFLKVLDSEKAHR
ncbi:peroxiredoxin family protein [Isoalcanivorax indicus]|uniref:peroxiredoxin family protein n=1 Tax=Isoalcanivorax indicus TaxID=2202653 RepID=UPI000DBAC81F|nr:redoxin domain-containing protein [Isoalcanivorax indicus]